MDLREAYKRMKVLSVIIDPNENELHERVELSIKIYNARRNEMTDEDIAKTRAFLSSDLYMMISVCYLPALDDLLAADIQMQRAEATTFKEELDEAMKTFSNSQAIDIARKTQKANEEFLEAYENFHTCKKIVNLYDKAMKMGGHVLNSMARRGRES